MSTMESPPPPPISDTETADQNIASVPITSIILQNSRTTTTSSDDKKTMSLQRMSSRSSSSSAAETLIRQIALRIGMDNDPTCLNQICHNLQKEYIQEEWQLAALDSFQWERLGVPMGLSTAICSLICTTRKVAAESSAATAAGSGNNTHHSSSNSLPSVLTSSSVHKQHNNAASSRSSVFATTPRTVAAPNHPLGKERNSVFPAATETKTSLPVVSSNNLWMSSSGTSTSSFNTKGSGAVQPQRSHVRFSQDIEEQRQRSGAPLSSSLVSSTSSLSRGGDMAEEAMDMDMDVKDNNNNLSTEAAATQNKKSCQFFQPKRNSPYRHGNATRPTCMTTFGKALGEYPKTTTRRSFPMSERFQQALIHSKNGEDLKEHTLFVMELSVLASALFVGAGVSLWGCFPMDSVGGTLQDRMNPANQQATIPVNFAIVYHCVAFITLLVQLLVTMGWIWTLHATAAVSAQKFHLFLIRTRYPFGWFLLFAEWGAILLTLNICLLFGAFMSATTTNVYVCQMAIYLPIILIILGCLLVHKFTSYIGRVAYHGLLLMDEDAETVLMEEESSYWMSNRCEGDGDGDGCVGSAERAESELEETFQRHNILCEKRVLDIYHRAMTGSGSSTNTTVDENAASTIPSLFDLFFPFSKPPPPPPTSQNNNKEEEEEKSGSLDKKQTDPNKQD